MGRAISRAEEEEQTMSGGGRRSELKRSSGIQNTKRWKLYEIIALKRKDGSGRYDWSLCATTRIFTQGFASCFGCECASFKMRILEQVVTLPAALFIHSQPKQINCP